VSNEFRKGDKVTWKCHGATVPGSVEEKITSDRKTAGRTVRASADDPQFRGAQRQERQERRAQTWRLA
jgi:Hypervirulence associated proteins TUDOR domain